MNYQLIQTAKGVSAQNHWQSVQLKLLFMRRTESEVCELQSFPAIRRALPSDSPHGAMDLPAAFCA